MDQIHRRGPKGADVDWFVQQKSAKRLGPVSRLIVRECRQDEERRKPQVLSEDLEYVEPTAHWHPNIRDDQIQGDGRSSPSERTCDDLEEPSAISRFEYVMSPPSKRLDHETPHVRVILGDKNT